MAHPLNEEEKKIAVEAQALLRGMCFQGAILGELHARMDYDTLTMETSNSVVVASMPLEIWAQVLALPVLRAHVPDPRTVLKTLNEVSAEVPEELRSQVQLGLQFLAGDPNGPPIRLTTLAIQPDGSDRHVVLHHPDGRKLQVTEAVWGWLERIIKSLGELWKNRKSLRSGPLRSLS